MRPFFDKILPLFAVLGVVLVVLSLGGCGKGKKVPGIENFHVGVMKGHLYVSFVSTKLQWDIGATIPIPGINDSSISVAPDLQSLGTVFQVNVSIANVLGQAAGLKLSGLPDGREIPDVDGGKLPRRDFEIKGLKVSLYLSDNAFGLFIPLDLSNAKGFALPRMLSISIEDDRGNRIGKAYAIPMNPMTASGSGILVLIPFPGGVSG